MSLKLRLPLLFCGILGIGSALHGSVILMDFGEGADIDPSDGWNTGLTIAGASGLVDTDDNVTSVGIAFSNWSDSNSTDTFAGRNERPSWAVDDALTDRLFTSAGDASVTISGLDPNLDYDLEWAASYPDGSGNGSQPATYELIGSNGVSAPYEGFNVFSGDSKGTTVAWTAVVDATDGALDGEEGWLGWFNVRPTSAGEIIVNVDADYLLNSSSRGALNAIRLAVVPEPSSYAALFGVVALAWVSCRRRR
ncbi:MAG: PEP-CTERM sorting domain-containing protein [Opitutales bacterium]